MVKPLQQLSELNEISTTIAEMNIQQDHKYTAVLFILIVTGECFPNSN